MKKSIKYSHDIYAQIIAYNDFLYCCRIFRNIILNNIKMVICTRNIKENVKEKSTIKCKITLLFRTQLGYRDTKHHS